MTQIDLKYYLLRGKGPVRLNSYSACSASFFQPEQYFSLTTIQSEQCFQPVSVKIQPAERADLVYSKI